MNDCLCDELAAELADLPLHGTTTINGHTVTRIDFGRYRVGGLTMTRIDAVDYLMTTRNPDREEE